LFATDPVHLSKIVAQSKANHGPRDQTEQKGPSLPEWTMQEKNEASSSEAQTSQVTVWTPEAEKTNPKYLQNHGIWTPNEDEVGTCIERNGKAKVQIFI
jgi:hypothetical protein